MKIRYLLIIIITYIFAFQSCKRDDQTRLQASWSTNDPIAIPLNIRQNQKNLQNLVPNHSFESGKIYYEESEIKSFDIDGWKKIGNNIEWVNTTYDLYNESEVYEGLHSVKITRNIADETEVLGEGVLSDFIKVIPGNYSLKLFLKLKDICPNQSRLGTKIFDAVNIRLQYFDKNKIEIDGIEFNPFTNKRIDNTFKSLSFANHRVIENFEWGEIYGRTINFPFFDGDIPDNARYIKIYIGLKGTGTMWIDNVEFNYTNQNFTQLERIKPYFDSSFTNYDFIFPTPKEIIKRTVLKFYSAENKDVPVILVPSQNNTEIILLAKKIQKALYKSISQVNAQFKLDDIRIVSKFDLSGKDANSFIVSLGETDLYQKNKSLLSDSVLIKHKESYIIKSIDELENMVFINALNINNIENAVYTFLQLIDSNNQTYKSANIKDYSDFYSRNVLIHDFIGTEDDFISKLDLLESYKFSGSYLEISHNNAENYPSFSIDQTLPKINTKGIFIDLTSVDKFNIPDNLDKNTSILVAENFPDPNACKQENYNKHDEKFHENILGILKKNKKYQIEYLSPYSNLEQIDRNEVEARFFLKEFKDHEIDNISFAWTGNSNYSLSMDRADFEKIIYIYKQFPIFFDNSIVATNIRLESNHIKDYYAGKIRVESLIEPYSFDSYNGYTENDSTRKVILNTESLSEFSIIRILTALDYYWNIKDYNPDKSLWVILNKLVGKDNAINLLYFNDSYYGLLEVCKKIQTNGSQHKNVRIAKNFESDLTKYTDLLLKDLKNEKLKSEILILKENAISTYNEVIAIDK